MWSEGARMKIYGKSCRSALKTKPDEQPIYDPSTKVIEKYRHQARRSQRSYQNYKFEYFERMHKRLQDPNSEYHGTQKAATLPVNMRCHCEKCERAIEEYNEKNRQRYAEQKAKKKAVSTNNKRGQW